LVGKHNVVTRDIGFTFYTHAVITDYVS